MGQKKLIRFAEIATFDHVLQYPENTAGKWHARFNNNNPIVLELACGKGEYSIGLATLHPNKNLIRKKIFAIRNEECCFHPFTDRDDQQLFCNRRSG